MSALPPDGPGSPGDVPAGGRRKGRAKTHHTVAKAVGATMVVLCIRYDALTPFTSGLAVVTAFVLRLLAMKYHWRAPRAWNRRSTVREE